MEHVKRLLLTKRYGGENTDCMVELKLDLDRIAWVLGNAAWRNKSKKSRALGGLIVARARQTESSK
jgi:hypothetical protein